MFWCFRKRLQVSHISTLVQTFSFHVLKERLSFWKFHSACMQKTQKYTEHSPWKCKKNIDFPSKSFATSNKPTVRKSRDYLLWEGVEGKCRKDKGHDLWYRPGSLAEFRGYPCTVCHTGVGNTSIYCNGCKLWVHKKCIQLQQLTLNPVYRCARCMGNARPIDGKPQSEVHVRPDKLEEVASSATWVTCFLLVEAMN